MIEKSALDVEPAEGDKSRVQYSNAFEFSDGGDSVQPTVDLVFVCQRTQGRRPLEEMTFIEHREETGAVF
jgi:hypothetical protein